MKNIFFILVFAVILTSNFSCSTDNDNESISPNYSEAFSLKDSMVAFYLGKDFKSEFEMYSYVCQDGDYNDNNATKAAIVGVRNGHLWLGIFNAKDREKVFEWTDTNAFEYHKKINLGYGEYKEVNIYDIYELLCLIQTSKGYLLTIIYNEGSYRESYSLYASKLEKLDYYVEERWFGDYIRARRDYSYLIVSPSGDILEEFTALAISELSGAERLSYCEGIKRDNLTFSRIKYETTVWETQYEPGFKVESDTKVESSILEKNGDIWVYQIVFTFYSGEKKTIKLDLNINDGTIHMR